MEQKKIYFLILICAVFALGSAQEVAYEGNPDKSFLAARNLAFSGKRIEARDTLQHILSKYPDYTDVRGLLAKTYSWDGEYGEARKHFNRIISVERRNKEVWIAAIKNEIYANNYPTAIGLANKALRYLKNDTDLELLRSQVLENINKQGMEKESMPKDSMETVAFKNRLGIYNALDVFSMVYDPMVYSSFEYKRDTKLGSIIPRVNYSNRFETKGVQYELDLHPKFSKTFHGYLNYGYSQSPIYPNHRFGADIYVNLPKSLEVSMGMRYLDFGKSNAQIITGSVGLYKGNYYFSLRPYITPPKDKEGIGFSGSLLVRRYLRDSENYLGINAVVGYAPELKQLSLDNVLLAENLLYIKSQQLILEYQFKIKDRPNIYRANIGVTRQELVFDIGNFFWSLSTGFTYQFKF